MATTFDEGVTAILEAFPRTSDINFTVGRAPQIEVDGELLEIQGSQFTTPLRPESTEALALLLFGEDESACKTMGAEGSVDYAHELPNGTRLRANIFRTRGNYSIVLRVLASKIPSLEDLGLPTALQEIAELRNGLVLVTGATGSGKTTTLAALVDRVNATRAVHVVTLEDPVEFVHAHKVATVNQRELGKDFSDFAGGLRAALRQAPKVILVGEMRDRMTLEIGLKAAETGHLVLSTLHTIDAGQTIGRVVGMFDQAEQGPVRSRLAEALRRVVSQRLLPRAGGGRVAAIEIMGSSLRTRQLIREGENENCTFRQVIAENRSQGWQTFDQHIVELFEQGLITAEIARSFASDPAIVGRALDSVRSQRGEDTSGLGELHMVNQRLKK
ncbi:MAG: type IV pilus twitching motility protein PilT [Planctomycetota bacterium]